jgi:PAS domain-containing protein
MQDVLPPNVGQEFHEAILQVLKTNSLVRIEYSLAMRNGEQSYEGRLLPLLEKQIIVVVRDISERKKADEVRQESEKRYYTLFEESRDAIL